MATDLAIGSVPPFYREVYDIVCPNPAENQIDRDLFHKLLVKSSLPAQSLSLIWDFVDTKQGYLTRTGLYKALALVAFAQQGKQISDKLLENFSGQELPRPSLGDLSEIRSLSLKLRRNHNPTRLNLTYMEICEIDTIAVDLVPEKKGLFLKHVEYEVRSEKHKSQVSRRYNDFVALHELLMARFPYRIIPKLPPKKMMVGADPRFIEDRRKALKRWLTLVARHPSVSDDMLVKFFLKYTGTDMQHKIREQFRRVPDEFVTSDLAAQAKELVPLDTQTQFASSRDQIRLMCSGVAKLKQIADSMVLRSQGYATDMTEFGSQLTTLGNEPHVSSTWATGGNEVWSDMKRGFKIISKEFSLLSNKAAQQGQREEDEVCEKLNLLLDLLLAYKDMCERHERGVISDHQRAMTKMLSMKKRRMQGVVRGTDSDTVDQLESRIIEQESVIANMETRNYFSLHCIHLETQLVHAYMEILASVLNTLVSVQILGHTEMARVWKQIRPTIEKCLPENQVNGSVSPGSNVSR